MLGFQGFCHAVNGAGIEAGDACKLGDGDAVSSITAFIATASFSEKAFEQCSHKIFSNPFGAFPIHRPAMCPHFHFPL